MWIQRFFVIIAALAFGSAPGCAQTSTQRQVTEARDWKRLFDGKTLDGWEQKGGAAKYRAQNGELIGITQANPQFVSLHHAGVHKLYSGTRIQSRAGLKFRRADTQPCLRQAD